MHFVGSDIEDQTTGLPTGRLGPTIDLQPHLRQVTAAALKPYKYGKKKMHFWSKGGAQLWKVEDKLAEWHKEPLELQTGTQERHYVHKIQYIWCDRNLHFSATVSLLESC